MRTARCLREDGKLRMWFSSATLGKSGLHTLHESRSADGIHWDEPSPALLENVYCPTVLKTERGYEMWFSDVSRRPWVIRHATSDDGNRWKVTPRPALVLSQSWEGEVLVYPTVFKVDGAYLMWYGSYDHAVRRETTAIGFAASLDGQVWHKHPHNPVLRPDPNRGLGIELRRQRLRDALGRRQLSLLVCQPQAAAVFEFVFRDQYGPLGWTGCNESCRTAIATGKRRQGRADNRCE